MCIWGKGWGHVLPSMGKHMCRVGALGRNSSPGTSRMGSRDGHQANLHPSTNMRPTTTLLELKENSI